MPHLHASADHTQTFTSILWGQITSNHLTMYSNVEEIYNMTKIGNNMKQPQQPRKRRHSDNDFSDDDSSSPKSQSPSIDDDRRAHHNELERRRRDHIKDHFMSLKDAIPLLEGEKSSRALILKRAVEYITAMQKRLSDNQKNMEELKIRNEMLEEKLKFRSGDSISPVSRPSPLSFNPVAAGQVPTSLGLPPLPMTTMPKTLSPVIGGLDALQINSMLASSESSLLALTQALLGCGKLSTPTVTCPGFQSLDSFVLSERQMAVRL
ncbi:unnamed protein product [Caenorhabditis auriculariae]|uniref:BHLH domain-containing protein n=1 Tax=Caenorhabditis auriculariae TaxID=2777116 RepID=A0A8S1GUS6_9PELO|nr:unnamed protein product [Caenorhabditis auriculariae]